ncbi:SpoIIE family protein phosphatase [Geodermatophilus sp. SYSU D00758]
MNASAAARRGPGESVERPARRSRAPRATGAGPEPRQAPERGPGAAPSGLAGSDGEEDCSELRRYQALVEYAPDAIVILDLDAGHFVTVNAAAERLFGMTRTALLRVGPVEVSPPVQPDGRSSETAAAEYLARALAGERPRFEWTHRRADGTDVSCEMTLLRLPDRDRRLVRGSIQDITARREAEAAHAAAAAEQVARRAAEASVARLQATVAGLNAIVWERDPATLRLTFVNERVEELLGYSAARWLTEEGLWTRILHPDDRDEVLARVRAEIAGDGVDFTLTYRVRAADGRWVWLQHLGHITRDRTGDPRTLHAVLFDVTAARRREQATSLLAAAGRALTDPGGLEERLAAVAGLLAGELGDWAAVWLRGDDDRYRPVAAAPADVADRVLAVGPLRVPQEFTDLVDAGRAFAVPAVTEQVLREAAADEDQYARLAALGGRAWLAAALRTAGEAVGLLTVATERRPGYDDADVAFAADLGQRIATMVAAERLAARQRQLQALTAALAAAGTAAEAGAALTASLREALDASVVAVCTLGGDGQLHTIDIDGHSPGWTTQFATIRLSASVPIADAARTRRPVWLPDRQTLLARYPDVEPFLQARTQATASLPLLAGQRLVGALGVVFARPRRFDAAERAFLLTVAAQAAAALERAALADVRREMAETLQRSLLPATLPQPERLAVAVRYLPAVAGTSAGGDWFDVLALPDGRVALAVGDVVGHGAPAAAVMGQLRSSLTTLLMAGFSPCRALELLDGFAASIAGARVSTAACLLLDPATGELAYSRAGHLPPLVADPAGITFLDGGLGPALGLSGTGARPEAATTLPAGATLLLFTDGLVEARGADLDHGLRRLAAAVAAHREAPLGVLVDSVLAALVGPAGADDVVVVAVRPLPEPLHLRLPADPAQLERVRRAVAAWAVGAALGADAVEDLQLAAGEAVANAVEHAYRDSERTGSVDVELAAERDGGVWVAVRDGGSWRPAPADPGFRGRGLQIISALGRDVEVDHGPAGTVLRFRLPPAAAAAVVPPQRGAEAGAAGATLTVVEADGRHLQLAGDLDLEGVDAVREALLAEVAGGRPAVLDLTRLGFVASVGAGLLFEAVRAAGAGLVVVLPAGGPARRLLDLSGLAGVLTGGERDVLPR